VLENCIAAQLATDVRLDDKGISLAFADAKLCDVVLDVAFVVVVVAGVVELSAARRFQIVNPGQSVPVDEVSVQAKMTRLSGDQPTAPLRSAKFLRIISVMWRSPGFVVAA
jgi:hypothetical protein